MVSRSNSVEVRIFGDISDIAKKLQTLEKQTVSSSKKLSSLGTDLTRNVTLPLAGLGAVATKAASDLGESINAVNVVFGDAADQIHEFGKTSAETVGLSARAFNQLVVPLGSVFQNFGDSADEAAKKSIELTQRAADMASVFNVDVTEALEAIQAALRGEADPIERFGVSVNAAAVEAKALALGLAETKSAITDADKAAARYALILEQTARVQGDFANTSDSLANKTRILKANAEDLAAEFGAALLPIMEDVVGVVGDVAETFSNLSPEMQETVVQMALLAAAAGPAAKAMGGVAGAVVKVGAALKALNLLAGLSGGGLAGLAAVVKAFGVSAGTAAAGVALFASVIPASKGLAELTKFRAAVNESNYALDEMNDRSIGTASAIRETVGEYRGFRNAVEQQIFLTRLQGQEQEELQRVFDRWRAPGEIPPPDTTEFVGRIAQASEVVQNFARQQLALFDPVLARALAEQRAAEAQERYAEVTKDTEASERDREKAAIDVLVAEAELDATTKDLSDTIDGPLIDAFDALLERTGLLREDFRFLIDDLREFNVLAGQTGVFVTSDGRAIPVRDLRRELIRVNQEVLE